MFSLLLFAAVGVGFARVAPAAAASMPGPFSIVQQFIDDFNNGNDKAAVALCMPEAPIVDEFAPHQWANCTAWDAAYSAYLKNMGETYDKITLGKPWHVDVTGNVAYVVVPATYAYHQHGKPMAETGSILTLIMSRSAAGWRIASWTWAKR